jgi:hypothetical protein
LRNLVYIGLGRAVEDGLEKCRLGHPPSSFKPGSGRRKKAERKGGRMCSWAQRKGREALLGIALEAPSKPGNMCLMSSFSFLLPP